MQQSSIKKALNKEALQTAAPIISILWDAAPLWGHLVLNAVIQTGLSYTLIRAEDCAEDYPADCTEHYEENTQKNDSTISRKDCKKNWSQSKILIVPGGFGRQKASKLGKKGIVAIRKFVENGGSYIGFCGGAGLALTDGEDGLALCPWGRSFYKDRIQHLVSGHLISSLNQDELIPELIDGATDRATGKEVSLPVWWPGRFQEPENRIPLHTLQSEVRVLARYRDMGTDLHVADLPIQKLPASTLEDWQNLYGVNLRPHLLDGQPAVITGSFGHGQYILSYSHLETPDSPAANAIFAHMLRVCLKDVNLDFAGATQNENPVFEAHGNGLTCNIFNTEEYCPTWSSQHYQFPSKTPVQVTTTAQSPSQISPKMSAQTKKQTPHQAWPILSELHEKFEELFKLGVDLNLLFPRTEWLYGWHNSVPGSQLNALRIALLRSLLLPVNQAREQYITTKGVHFSENMLIFISGAKSWLLARRLIETMGETMGENTGETAIIPRPILQAQRQELFGIHMTGGGLCGSLLDWLDEFLFLD